MDVERQGIVMSYECLHDAIKKTYDTLLDRLASCIVKDYGLV